MTRPTTRFLAQATVLACLMALPGAAALASGGFPGDPQAGARSFVVCSACHTLQQGGAALIGHDGRLLGIGSLIVNDAAPPGRNALPGNLFVPVSLLGPVLDELLAQGRRAGPARPWLGVSTEPVRGILMVARVTPGGPAEQAGLTPGDVIVGVGDAAVGSQADFYRKLWKAGPAGAEIPLRVLKGGAIREMKVRSVDRDDFLRKPHGV
jgi:serine protease Do